MKQAEIYVNEVFCGILTEDEEGFTVGGGKNGFDRNTFIKAFTHSGISDVLTGKMIDRMVANIPQWKELINQSFLPTKMKTDYCSLLDKRERALGL